MTLQFLPKRVVFDLTNELIEKLLLLFCNAGFPVVQNFNLYVEDKYPAVPFAHWPDITLSDKKPTSKEEIIGINDLLGAYQLKDWETKEGTIVIYYEAIWETALDYIASDISIAYTTEECFDCLVSIVAVHEFVHWIMHTVVGLAPLKYDNYDSKCFHEGFAQLFTWYSIFSLEKLGFRYGSLIVNIFQWLSDRQQVCSSYKEIESMGLDGKRITYEEIFKLLRWFKSTGLQSFKAIKPSLKMIRLQDSERLSVDDPDLDYWVEIIKEMHRSRKFSLDEIGAIYFCLPSNVQGDLKGYYYGWKYGII